MNRYLDIIEFIEFIVGAMNGGYQTRKHIGNVFKYIRIDSVAYFVTMAKTKTPLPAQKNKKSRARADDTSSSSSSDDSDYDPETDSNRQDTSAVSSSDTEGTDATSDSDRRPTIDKKKFQKMMYELFPSKYTKSKLNETVSSSTSSRKKSSSKKKHSSHRRSESDGHRRHKHRSRKEVSSSEEESEESEEENEESEDASDEWETDASGETLGTEDTFSDSEEEEEEPSVSKNIDIVLNIGGMDDGMDDDAMSYVEDENEKCDTDDEKAFMKERYEECTMPETPEPPASSSSRKKSHKSAKRDKQSKKNAKPAKKEEEEKPAQDADKEYAELVELKKHFIEQLKRHPNNKILKRSIQQCKDDINKLVKDARNQNAKQYHKLMNAEFIQTNEIEYFKKKMSNQEQLKVMEDFREINSHIYTEMPHRLALLRSSIPAKFKALAMRRLNMLANMEPSDNEYHKIKTWVDAFMRIPFGIYKQIPISMSDGMETCHKFMHTAKQTLDTCVYGMNDAKMQIMQMMGQWIVNPSAMGSAIAIHGPPGTGKTSIVKDGISKILGREFAFVPLGGCGDASYLEGHAYTYEGSIWGHIVQILMNSKCMNPIIYFDELDKLSETPRGQEVVGILTHLTDSTQNSQFHDKYFSEVDFDLSKCLFIFSYNDEHAINPILKDRMYHINTKGYENKEKIKIARDYLLPKIREQVKFSDTEVVITDEVLHYLISTPKFCKGEQGVRNLKRCLEIIYTKLNLFRFTTVGDSSFLKEQMDLQVTFPITLTNKDVNVLVKSEESINPILWSMYT